MRPTDALDALLSRSEPDSLDWADGGGHERARELLLALSDDDWVLVEKLAARRDARLATHNRRRISLPACVN